MTNTRVSTGGDAGQSPLALDGMRILVVDDDVNQTEMYIFTLERLGAAVASVASAEDALAALAVYHFDVVVSDIALPDCDGYELARAVRAAGLAVPAVALTGWDEPGERETALAAGFDEFCTKPCLPSELAFVIRRLIRPATDTH